VRYVWSHRGNRCEENTLRCTDEVVTPVIPATQEAAIRRIAVRGQPRQMVLKTLSQKYPT
jgi:hypothetical protein